MPTTSSRGACMSSTAPWNIARLSRGGWAASSSRKAREISKLRPAIRTTPAPSRRTAARSPSRTCCTWAGSAGAPMVATARTDAIAGAALRTAAPPREWPTRRAGGATTVARCSAAVLMSATSAAKPPDASAPSLAPIPAKSKDRTAKPSDTRAAVSWRSARRSFEHVKQWAKTALARTGPRGTSSRAASDVPREEVRANVVGCGSMVRRTSSSAMTVTSSVPTSAGSLQALSRSRPRTG